MCELSISNWIEFEWWSRFGPVLMTLRVNICMHFYLKFISDALMPHIFFAALIVTDTIWLIGFDWILVLLSLNF